MMKKIGIILLIVALILAGGCTDENEEKYNHYLELSYEGLFDRARHHKPTEEEVLSVKKGMKFYDVVESIGLPHARAADFLQGAPNEYLYIWVTDEGNAYGIYFYPYKEIDISVLELTINKVLLYSSAYDEPHLLQYMVPFNTEPEERIA